MHKIRWLVVGAAAALLVNAGAAAAADRPCAGVDGPCFWVAEVAQRPDGSTVAVLRGQRLASDADVLLFKKITGFWVVYPHVDGFPPDTRHNGSFRGEAPASLLSTGEYRVLTSPASSREAYLQVLDIECPDHPGPCKIDQISN